MYYELATITVRLGAAAKAVPCIAEDLRAPRSRGELLGCWLADIGELNRIVVLRGFDDAADLLAERQRVQLSGNPFGCAEFATQVELESYAPFPWLPRVAPGEFGAFYEIRTYEIRTGGLQPTLDAWRAALPARHALSSCLVAMYALDGVSRMTSIWPFATLEQRSRVRAAAVEQGIWPPKGGPAWLTPDMRCGVYLPTAISPLK